MKRAYTTTTTTRKSRQLPSGRVITYGKSAPVFGSSRYNRKMRRGNPYSLQRAPRMHQELGFVDIAAATYALDTTGSITLLNTVAQGTSVNQRVGKKYAMKGLQSRGSCDNNAAALYNDIAYMIVYDRRPTGALPAITDILVTANARAMNNDANAGRFQILKRVDASLVGNLSVTGVVANFPTNRSDIDADWYLDLHMKPVVCKAAGTGAIGDIEEGALYLVTVGTNAAGTSAAQLTTGMRLRFQDT